MWKYLAIFMVAGLASCSGAKTDSGESGADKMENPQASCPDLLGQWGIENIVENDSSYVRPAEIGQGLSAYIEFRDDNTFGVMTNCNHIGGQYTQSGDSIALTDILTTEMACDNMEVEEMLKKILPLVNTVDCLNDSITRLNAAGSEAYIVLHKPQQDVK